MNFLDICQDLTKRISSVQHNRKTIGEKRELETRLSEVNQVKSEIDEVHDKVQLLQSNKVPIDTSEVDISGVVNPLEIIIGRFNEDPKAKSLTKGKDWVDFTNNASQILGEFENLADEAWLVFAQGKFSGEKPDNLNVAGTDHNVNVLRDYSVNYEEFQRYLNNFPDDSNYVVKTVEISKKLESIRKSFNFDVPQSVDAFLSSVALGGAPLNLLTDEVIGWLEDNQSQNQYRIIRKLR